MNALKYPEASQLFTRTQRRNLLNTLLTNATINNLLSDDLERLQEIDKKICDFLQHCDPTIREKVVLLIDHIILKDKLSEENVFIWENNERNKTMNEMLKLLPEFSSRSSSLDLKEIVYYYAANLCFKVHDYTTALNWFMESKNVYVRNTAGNKLSEKERYGRDIFIAFCYEYIGKPEKSIEFILGIPSIDIFETAIFSHKNEIISAIVSSNCKTDRYYLLKTILGFSEFNNRNVLHELIYKNQGYNVSLQEEKDELIHVFAHCLSEYKVKANSFDEDQYGKNKFTSLISMMSIKLIEILPDQYITCKAIIHAEWMDSYGALSTLPNDDSIHDPKELAEVNFYRFYFTELFNRTVNSNDSNTNLNAGLTFKEYCLNSKLDDCSRRDALLHFHIFEVKRRLRMEIEKIFQMSQNKNSYFFSLNFKDIDEQWNESFGAVTKQSAEFKDGFSSFANSEIKKELHLLHICLNILLEVQDIRLPLFFTNDEQEQEFDFNVNGNQLFELCKMFSEIFNNKTNNIIKNSDAPQSKYRTYCINNCYFDIIASDYNDYINFEEDIQQLFDGEQMCYINAEFSNQLNTTKIVFGKAEWVKEKCEHFSNMLTHNRDINIRVFYVGDKNEAYYASPIVAFEELKTCILMAFIYATIESILDYICKPRPIYILAPLRDTGSYYFQMANLRNLIYLGNELPNERKINSEGMGIKYNYNSIINNREEFACIFKNNNIKEACSCALIYKNSKLFVLRNDKFIEKKYVNHQLIQYYYNEYIKNREKCRKCSFVHNNTQSNCSINGTLYCDYVFRKSNALFHNNETKNPIAKSLLLELITLACKEEILDYDNLYVMENSLLYGVDENNISFTIALFKKDISSYGCYKEWITFDNEIIPAINNEINNFAQNDFSSNEKNICNNYNELVSTYYKNLENERERCLELWIAYRSSNKSTNNIGEVDKKIDALSELKVKIEVQKNLWMEKNPQTENEKSDFYSCPINEQINNELKELAYESEE